MYNDAQNTFIHYLHKVHVFMAVDAVTFEEKFASAMEILTIRRCCDEFNDGI